MNEIYRIHEGSETLICPFAYRKAEILMLLAHSEMLMLKEFQFVGLNVRAPKGNSKP
jgi:hypothetical protein